MRAGCSIWRTKGSGQTPYSRFGDGRLTLKGGVREVLAAEMLEALGVYTSKAFSLFETGEALTRGDEPSPTRSSVLVRLAHSHIRFGTFQRLAFFERPDLIHTLIEHVVRGVLSAAPRSRAARRGRRRCSARSVEANARLAASWMAAGFVHGVLNTDNLNVTGESFDYGPWRFLPTSDPGFTAAYFDETGLYAFGRQPEAVSWALAQLGGALSLVCPAAAAGGGTGAVCAGVSGRAARKHVRAAQPWRRRASMQTCAFLQTLFGWLTQSQAGWDQFFHDWYCGGASAERARAEPASGALRRRLRSPRCATGLEARTGATDERVLAHAYFQRPTPHTMLIDEVEALVGADRRARRLVAVRGQARGKSTNARGAGVACHRVVASAE